EAAGAFVAVTRDERDRVALVEQLDHAFDLRFANLEVLSDAGKVERSYSVHGSHPPRGGTWGKHDGLVNSATRSAYSSAPAGGCQGGSTSRRSRNRAIFRPA